MSVDKRGIIVSVILLAIALLFVVGVGNTITGNFAKGVWEIEVKVGEEVNFMGHTIKVDKVAISTLDDKNQVFSALVTVDGQKTSNYYTDRLIEGGKSRIINGLKLSVPKGGIKYPQDSKFTTIKLTVTEGVQVTGVNVITNYPQPFIKNNNYNNLYIVLSNGYSADEKEVARVIARSLRGNRRLLPNIVTESEIKDTEGKNLIIIGKACENALIAKFLRTNSCNINYLNEYEGLQEGEGYIEFLPQGSRPPVAVIVLTGYSDMDTLKAATVMAHTDFYVLESNKVIVKGDLKKGIYGLEIKELQPIPYRHE